ncbi:hypothetical protein GJ744_002602 [Endocarpon pusillum]|uniref:Uncharacterized protein n=1 Tax=Endocarpon pusillum TaxID=364733 RepID=A0A8H7A7W3_9EURO|nr:hypothetical protein GJ744_002602 [Endocarpon pusillum]
MLAADESQHDTAIVTPSLEVATHGGGHRWLVSRMSGSSCAVYWLTVVGNLIGKTTDSMP